MRRLFVSADMEGCAAVSSQLALAPERPEWTAARHWMTQEVVAVSEAALESGYDEVIVADSHGNAHNIIPDLLPPKTRLIRSWPRPLLQVQGVEIEDVQACAMIGYHCGSTSFPGTLAHSFSGPTFRSIRLNGELCSEGYLGAAVAGEFGRPVILVSGDDALARESVVFAPAATRFTSKTSLGWRSQMSESPSIVCAALKVSAASAFQAPLPEPFRLKGPYELELNMTTQLAAEVLAYLPDVKRVDACSVAARFDRVASALKFLAFAMFYSPIGVVQL